MFDGEIIYWRWSDAVGALYDVLPGNEYADAATAMRDSTDGSTVERIRFEVDLRNGSLRDPVTRKPVDPKALSAIEQEHLDTALKHLLTDQDGGGEWDDFVRSHGPELDRMTRLQFGRR